MKIFKYQLTSEVTTIKMLKGAVILSVQTQFAIPTIWAIVDENAEKEERTFRIEPTGQELHPGCYKDSFLF